jgi:hypothetical protein
MTKKEIGIVAVDSGQLVICDPCYIDSEWDKKDAYYRDQFYDVKWAGRDYVIDMGDLIMNKGWTFSVPFRQFGGKTMNTLVRQGLAVERPRKETGVFGYNGCCKASTNENRGGGLKFKMGHFGAGVAVSSGYGDGVYPVIAHYNKDGRVAKVEIKFIEED